MRPTSVGQEPAVTEEPRPTRVDEAPAFRYPAPDSGDGMLRDGPAREEVAAAPRIGWEMVSASPVPCPDNPDLQLLSAERQPFWALATPTEPLSEPASTSQGRRQRAIQRGARSRRGSAETRRTVQRRVLCDN